MTVKVTELVAAVLEITFVTELKSGDEVIPLLARAAAETADAACGGNPWAVTYLDCFRYLDQMGRLAKNGVDVIFHNY